MPKIFIVDILYKFPQNKRALDGIKALRVGSIKRASNAQEPPEINCMH